MSEWVGQEQVRSRATTSPIPGALRADPAQICRAAIRVAGEALIPQVSGALWWPAASTLIVADLHLEKGSAHAARGVMLPPYDTCATLQFLEAVIGRFRPGRVIALGDSFHDGGAGGRIGRRERDRLSALQEQTEWLWVAGNHDPDPPVGIGGRWHGEIAVGPFLFRHEPSADAQEGEVAGHLHPVAKVTLRGRTLRRRCFASDGRRLVLPAFGAFTGGLNVLDAAYRRLFPERAFDAWLLGARAVYPIAGRKLIA